MPSPVLPSHVRGATQNQRRVVVQGVTFQEYEGMKELRRVVAAEHNAAIRRMAPYGRDTVQRFLLPVLARKAVFDDVMRDLYATTATLKPSTGDAESEPAGGQFRSDFNRLLDALSGWRAEVRYQEARAHLAHTAPEQPPEQPNDSKPDGSPH